MTARDLRVDTLRGLAIFGVLLMNLPVYARSPVGTGWVESILPGVANLGPALFIWLGQGKFLAILAGLFGRGMQGTPTGQAVRRLGVLAALGVLHGLVWPGDILVAWAFTGGILRAIRRVPHLGLLGLLVPAALVALGYPALLEPARRAAVASHAAHGWTPLLVMWAYLPLQVPVMVAQATLALRAPRPQLLALAGLALAVVPALPLLVPLSLPGWVSALAGDLGATGVSPGVAALALRSRPSPWLAAVGAMPLTNYLLHTAIFVTFVPPRLGAVGVFALATCTFAALALVSRLWLSRYARGPVEALWRRIYRGRETIA